MKALREEVKKATKIDIWKPVHRAQLSDEQKALHSPSDDQLSHKVQTK